MYVRLRVTRQVKVDDEIDGGNIETARGDVSGYEDIATTGFKLVQSAETRRLRELAVKRYGAKPKSAKEDCDTLGLVDSAGEYDDRVANVIVEEMDEV